MTCKGICARYDTQPIEGNKRGMKYPKCNTCDIRIKWDGVHCPCCGNKFSRRNRNGRSL